MSIFADRTALWPLYLVNTLPTPIQVVHPLLLTAHIAFLFHANLKLTPSMSRSLFDVSYLEVLHLL